MRRVTSWGLGLMLAVLTAGAGLAAEKDAAIGGYCPVAYVKMNQAVKGDPRWSSERDGQRFLFSAAEAKAMYDAAPDQYKVAYHGWCATAVAMGKKIAADPTIFTVHQGVAYLFSSAEAKAMFDKDPAGIVAKADKAWPALTAK